MLQGRWRFEGTHIAIADVRRDFAIGDGHIMEPYRKLGISDHDIEAALAFEFPAIRSGQVEVDSSYITVHCVCGEDTREVIAWPAMTARCVCGRVWKVTVAVDRLPSEETHFTTNGYAQGSNGSNEPEPTPPLDGGTGGGSPT